MFYVGHELLTGGGECPAVVERELSEEGTPAEGALARPVVAGKLVGEEAALEGGVAIGALDREEETGIAVDQASSASTPLGEDALGDAYVNEGSAVAVFDSTGGLVERFGSGALEEGQGVAMDSRTGDVFVLDGADNEVEVFQPAEAGAPEVEGLTARNVAAGEVQLSATVDPNGSDTHYFFQYGTANCVSEPSACTDVPAPPGRPWRWVRGRGGQRDAARPRACDHLPLPPRRESEQFGAAEASETLESFLTLPASSGLLGDGRAWELVSPAEKHGAAIEPFMREGSVIQASAGGGAVAYVASGPTAGEPQGNRAPEPTQVISRRTPGGWVSEDAETPHEKGEGIEGGEPSEYRAFSADLALALVQPPGAGVEPFEAPPLAGGSTEKTIYVAR